MTLFLNRSYNIGTVLEGNSIYLSIRFKINRMKFVSALIIVSSLLNVAYGQIESESSLRFGEVLTYVNRMYVDPVNDQKLTDAAIIALLEELDPHSTFISREEVDEANEKINGSFVGIGIRFQILKDTLMVVSTIPGGPSEKLGIQAGDKIVAIENENVAGIGLKNNQVREKLMGELGTKVKVEIIRRNSPNLDFVITRDKIPVHSVDASYMLSKDIGYIKLNAFSRTTMLEIQQSLDQLKDQGMKSLILDLQGNGGGLLYAAQELADEFLSKDKLIVYSEGRSRPRSDLKAGKKGKFEEGKLVILTDEYSASASEIVSGAIQDWDRGLIVGRRTYGKGLVQQPIDLSDGSQMRLTVARYFTPTGRFIQKPYDNNDDYRKDINNRYLNGEFSHADSIKLADSLKHETLVKKRTVYGGGGIMPDIFVPIDTSEITDYFSAIVRRGLVNSFTLTYVDRNRASLRNQYTDFKVFNEKFVVDNKLEDLLFEHINTEAPDLTFDEEQYKISKNLLHVRIKALIAQDLWGYQEFYQVYNQTNEILQRALLSLQSGEYDKMNLDR